MAIPSVSESFGDLLDIRFQDIFDDKIDQLDDMLPTLFAMPPDNGRNDMRWSQVGAFGDNLTNHIANIVGPSTIKSKTIWRPRFDKRAEYVGCEYRHCRIKN